MRKEVDRSDSIKQNVKVSGEAGDITVIGKVVQSINKKVLRRIGIQSQIGFAVLGTFLLVMILGLVVIVALVVERGPVYSLYQSLFPQSAEQMTGHFNIAVAGFTEFGATQNSDIGVELAQGIHLSLEQDFQKIPLDFVITVWGPEQIGYLPGKSSEGVAILASEKLQEIDADMIIYGIVDTTDKTWEVKPKFLISSRRATDNFYQAAEVTGQHALGTPITITEHVNVADRIASSKELSSRAQVITQLTIGLAHYANHDYEDALGRFHMAKDMKKWESHAGREVILLLIGNALMRSEKFDEAEIYYQKTLDLDPGYARGYLGLANVHYRRAQIPFEEAMDPGAINLDLVERASDLYIHATEVSHQPLLADIQVKSHFGLGQCYFLRVYSGKDVSFDSAIAEFKAVIAAYGNGDNPRVIEFAGEAYARLALIYDLSGHPQMAIDNYKQAASLLECNRERQKYYQNRAETIEYQMNKEPPQPVGSDDE